MNAAFLTAADRSPMNLVSSGLVVLALLTFAGLAGCSGKTSDRDLVFLKVSETQTLLAGKEKFIGGTERGVAVDPRRPSEFALGHIPGAINLPLEVARDEHEVLRGSDMVIVYGEDYNSALASSMAKILMELGYDVSILRGGLTAWEEAGLELEKGLPNVAR